MAVAPCLERGVGGDLDDEPWLNLDQRRLAPFAPVSGDLVRPRMPGPGGLQQLADCRGLVVIQPGGAPDHLEDFAAVSADDQSFGCPEAAGDRADDRVEGVAVLDLLEGGIMCRALS
ncbi:hypothetical protein ACI2LF_23850 [Kribbella sp. NPDC020789]